MTSYLIKICYDGRNFKGYQIQVKPNAERTVGGEIRKALLSLFGEASSISGCSRTDAGVHALCYYVSFKAEREYPTETVVNALNAKLPNDISVISCEYVSDDFHARYSVKSKEYIYKIYNSDVRNPFYDGLLLYYPHKIDEKLLNGATKNFIGKHDFSSFMASGSKITETVRTVYDAKFEKDGEIYIFTVSADGFLYNMVRIMVGTLLEINSGRLNADSVPLIIDSKNRDKAGKTAPPDGLYLNKVIY